MNKNIPTLQICISTKGNQEPRIDSRVLAKLLGMKHRSVFRQISNKLEQFKEHGLMRFKVAEIKGKGQPEKYALLNEAQSYLMLTVSRNTAVTVPLKSKLINAFMQARYQIQARQTEYLPSYHALHDLVKQKAEKASNPHFLHSNINKAINKAIAIESGTRTNLSYPQASLLVVAQMMVANAIEPAKNHKEAYMLAKASLQQLNALLTTAQPQEAITK